MTVWADNLNSMYQDSTLHLDLFNICFSGSTPVFTECSVLVDVSGSYTQESLRKFCHLASTSSSFSSAQINQYCGSFPQTAAIELSNSISDIRTSISSVSSVFPGASFVVGTGWLDSMLNSGVYSSDSLKFIKYDKENERFIDEFFEERSAGRVSVKPGHRTHLHMDLQ